MNLTAAIDYLKLGKKIRRKAWDDNLFLQYKLNGNDKQSVMCFRLDAIPFSYDLDILLSNDWQIKGEPIADLTLDQAIVALHQGHKVKLPHWETDYLEMGKFDMDIFLKTLREYNFVPSFACFLAQDWEIIE